MMEPYELTPTQERVLVFICDHRDEWGFPPTRAEISSQFGWRSANAAEEVVRALQKKGRLKVFKGVARGLVPS